MAWDTEGTRQRLLDAGARQFAANGYTGAHMEAIGRDAGVNKERVYQYFGNKRGLFDAVLADRLGDLFHAAGILTDAGDYAGALFDRLVASPDLARLLAWESLELDTAADAVRRAEACEAKIDELRAARPELTHAAAAQLLLSIVTLAVGWWSLARVADMIAPGADHAARRGALVAQARAIA